MCLGVTVVGSPPVRRITHTFFLRTLAQSIEDAKRIVNNDLQKENYELNFCYFPLKVSWSASRNFATLFFPRSVIWNASVNAIQLKLIEVQHLLDSSVRVVGGGVFSGCYYSGCYGRAHIGMTFVLVS